MFAHLFETLLYLILIIMNHFFIGRPPIVELGFFTLIIMTSRVISDRKVLTSVPNIPYCQRDMRRSHYYHKCCGFVWAAATVAAAVQTSSNASFKCIAFKPISLIDMEDRLISVDI